MYFFVDGDKYLRKNHFGHKWNFSQIECTSKEEGQKLKYFVAVNEAVSKLFLCSPSSDSFIIISTSSTY